MIYQTALVTGASAGFGRETVLQLVSKGIKVVALARRLDRLQALQKECGAEFVHIVAIDLNDSVELERVLTSLPADFSEIDILVNNAGLALGLSPAQDCSLQDWNQMIDTNIKSLVHVTRLILPGMVLRNRGHIFNIGSVAGHTAYPGGNVYSASKAFVAQFSKNLRVDLFGTALRVTDIQPGAAETEFSLVRFSSDQSRADSVYEGYQALTAKDVVDSLIWILERPAHVNIDAIEVMPVAQSSAGLRVYKGTPRDA